ncbi:MAG TPA: hypothetical protein VFN56_03275 [Candidatus Saccharimonadales bacterium]|nr:hypothetical protein [Candidatus Saccharimonadales bacterium]
MSVRKREPNSVLVPAHIFGEQSAREINQHRGLRITHADELAAQTEINTGQAWFDGEAALRSLAESNDPRAHEMREAIAKILGYTCREGFEGLTGVL